MTATLGNRFFFFLGALFFCLQVWCCVEKGCIVDKQAAPSACKHFTTNVTLLCYRIECSCTQFFEGFTEIQLFNLFVTLFV